MQHEESKVWWDVYINNQWVGSTVSATQSKAEENARNRLRVTEKEDLIVKQRDENEEDTCT